MKIVIDVFLKSGILDPQGKATEHALAVLGFEGVEEVRIGKQIVLNLATKDAQEAISQADAMAKKLLVNEVIEDYTIEPIQ